MVDISKVYMTGLGVSPCLFVSVCVLYIYIYIHVILYAYIIIYKLCIYIYILLYLYYTRIKQKTIYHCPYYPMAHSCTVFSNLYWCQTLHDG